MTLQVNSGDFTVNFPDGRSIKIFFGKPEKLIFTDRNGNITMMFMDEEVELLIEAIRKIGILR